MTNAGKPNQDAINALKAQMAAQLVGHHVGPQSEEVYAQKPTNYVYASNGTFRVVQTPIAQFITKIGDVEAGVSIPGNTPMAEGPQLLIPKIPFKYWLQVLSWYKDVHTKDSTEASILFFWNTNNVEIPTAYESGREITGLTQDGQLIIYCPDQKNSSGLSDFTMDTMVPWLRQNTTPLCETHSHHTMGAFWSGTDNANENMTQFYGVYGQIKTQEPQFLFRYVSGEHKINISHWTLFEKPNFVKKIQTIIEIPGQEAAIQETVEEIDYAGPWPMVAYPEDWMAKHAKSWTTTGASYGYNAAGYKKGPTQASYGRGATPSNGGYDPYKEWPTGSYDDYEEGYYGGAYGYNQGAGGAKRTTSASTGGDVQGKEVKKNSAKEISSLAQLGKKDEDVSEVIETDSSYIEILASEIMDTCDADDMKKLLQELCDYGYDYVITDFIKDQGDYRYADM